ANTVLGNATGSQVPLPVPGQIIGAQITSGTVTGGNIASATITGGNIASATITGGNIASNTVANSNLANMAANSIKCNNTGGSATPIDCTAAQAGAIITGKIASIAQQTFCGSGCTTTCSPTCTYTPTSGMLFADATCTGGGGGGGGTPVTTAAQISAGGGGASGGVARGIFSAATIGVSQSLSIGAAGTTGSNTGRRAGGNTQIGGFFTAHEGGRGPRGASAAYCVLLSR